MWFGAGQKKRPIPRLDGDPLAVSERLKLGIFLETTMINGRTHAITVRDKLE